MSDPSNVPAVPLNELEAVPPVIETITHAPALSLLRRAVVGVAGIAEFYKGDPFATGTALVHLDQLMRDLRSVVADLKRWTADAMPAKQIVIPTIGVLERAGEGTVNKWDDLATMNAVISWAWKAGKINGPHDVAPVLLEFCHIDYWRKTPMQKARINYGPDRDDDGDAIEGTGLVQVTYGDPSVRIVSRNDQ